ncbi:MAG: Na+/H+ antiporter NhaC [Synergistaceae bacterium]|jgi:NhaC family Na+:H+ antiporter|nr:Na+/H+ antiporter NhaC [Synergistaceae bacterium]
MSAVHTERVGRRPSFFEAFILTGIAATLILTAVVVFEQDVHIPLVLSAAAAVFWSLFVLKERWAVIEEGILNSIMTAMQAILILYTVGTLIGVWVTSGVVPTMIYYGLDMLSPSMFLIATLVICSVVSLATGSSWGTSGTVGIALMGIGAGLGIPAPVSAGFVVSGAYFGDKMSPLSDTTNLAPAVAGTDIFQHIRAMCWTTGPTYVIVLLIAGIMGIRYAAGVLDTEKITAIQTLMSSEFTVSVWGFIPPLLVISLAASKKPALPSVFAGVVAGCVLAAVHGVGYGTVMSAMQNGYTPALSGEIAALGEALEGSADLGAIGALMAEAGVTGVTPESALQASGVLVELLEAGGLQSMNWTVSLIICALTFGGVLDSVGYLEVLLDTLLSGVRSVGGLTASVIGSCFVTNLLTGDQYISLVLPGRMFKERFEKAGLHPRMLSRSLEDSGTLTSVLIPWNTCGAYHWNTLGVHPFEYAPYAFLNWLNPLIAIVLTYTGVGVAWRRQDSDGFVIARTKPAGI